MGQDRTEHHLERAVEAEPLIELRYGHTVTGLVLHDRHVEVTAATADGPRELRARWLVGADGGGSAVRKVLGLPLEGRSFDDRFLICDIRADLPWRIDWQVPRGFDLETEEASGGRSWQATRPT